jgi:hypothetical protein
VTGGAVCSCSRKRSVAGTVPSSRDVGPIRIGRRAGPQPAPICGR